MRKRTHVREYYRRHHGTSDMGGSVTDHDRGYEAAEAIRKGLREHGALLGGFDDRSLSEIRHATAREDHAEDVKIAYADSYMPFEQAEKVRKLSWEGTPFLPVDEAKELLKLIGNYNNFDPEGVGEYLGNMANIRVKIARAGSPEIFVQGNDLDELAGDAEELLRADEVDFVKEKLVYPSEEEMKKTPVEGYGHWLDVHTRHIPFKEKTLRLWWD